MRRFSSAPRYCRLCAFILLGLLALSLAACDGNRAASSRPASSTAPDDTTGPVLAEISAAYGACLDRCNEQTSLGSLTREGCFAGCAEIRRQTDVRDKVYPSRQACLDDMRTVDLNRDLIIERYQAWCLQQWNHLHKRRGCLDAIEVFYSHITADTVCGPIAASRDRVSVSPLAPPPLSSGASSMQMPPVAQPAPMLAAPAAQPAAAPFVSPAVRDTPKYRTASVKKTATKKAKAPAQAKGTKPAPKVVEKDTPMPEPSEPKVPPVAQPASPQAAVPQMPKASAQPAAPPQPAAAPVSAPAPAAPSAQPAPAVAPKPPVAPAQPSPAAPMVPAAPMPAAQPQATAAPASQPPASATPVAQPAPQAAVPEAKTPASSNSTMPQPAPEAQSIPPTLVPVPSMLEREYTSPAVLAPQGQGGQGSAAPLVPPLPPVNQTPPVAP